MSLRLGHGSSRFLLKPLPGSGGFLSRVFLAQRPGDRRRYVLKVGSGVSPRQKWAGELRLFERELAAYRLLAPLNAKFSPRMFSGVSAERGSDGLILLEEIRHARIRDQLQGLTGPELASAVRAIANIHARFWSSPSLKQSPGLSRHHYMRAHQVHSHLPGFFRWANLPLKKTKLFRSLPDLSRQALGRLRKAPVTLVHGDFRSDNLFFGQGTVKIIDWAFSTTGAGVFDVARLAGGSPKRPLSLLQHVDLFGVWHRELLRQGVRHYPLHQAWQDYRDAVVLTLTIPVTNGPALARFSARGRRLAQRALTGFLRVAQEVGV